MTTLTRALTGNVSNISGTGVLAIMSSNDPFAYTTLVVSDGSASACLSAQSSVMMNFASMCTDGGLLARSDLTLRSTSIGNSVTDDDVPNHGTKKRVLWPRFKYSAFGVDVAAFSGLLRQTLLCPSGRVSALRENQGPHRSRLRLDLQRPQV